MPAPNPEPQARPSPNHAPTIEALIPCVATRRAGPRGQLTLEGVFTVVRVRWLPVLLPAVEVFVRVRGGGGPGGEGPSVAWLEVVHRATGRRAASRVVELVFEPVAPVHDFAVPVREVWLEREGVYEVGISIDARPATLEGQAVFEAVVVVGAPCRANGQGAG